MLKETLTPQIEGDHELSDKRTLQEDTEINVNENQEMSDKELLAKMQEHYDKLEKLRLELNQRKGNGAGVLEKKMQSGANLKDLNRQCEQMADLREAKELAYKKLEDLGVISYTADGKTVVDLDFLKQNTDTELLSEFGTIFIAKYLGDSSISKTLRLLFKDVKAISKEDYEAGEENEKKLFYFPDSKEQALDMESIKGSQFHLSLFDVYRAIQNYSSVRYGDIEDLDYREVLLPLLIYHPTYMDGYRDEAGKLMIRGEDGEYKKLASNDIYKRYGAFGNSRIPGESMNTPRAYVRNELPNLIETGLLKPEDFEIMSTSSTAEAERVDKKINTRGTVMFDSVRYILGSEYDPKNGNFKAFEIANDLGGIVEVDKEGARKLVATFGLISRETARKSSKGYAMVGKNEANIKKYEKEEIYNKRADESNEEFKQRVGEYESFENIINVSKHISDKTGINLADFSFKEQQLIATAASKMNFREDDRFIKFINTFGEYGLKSFIAMEYGDGNAKKIIEIGDNLPPIEANKFFDIYGRIYDRTANLASEIKNSKYIKESGLDEETKQKLYDNFPEALLRRATDMLHTAHLIATNKQAKAEFYGGKQLEVKDIKEVYEAFDTYKEFLDKLESLFTDSGDYKYEFNNNEELPNYSVYNFEVIRQKDKARSYFALHLRDIGTNKHYTDIEFDGEARINFLFSNEPIPKELSSQARKEAITFRIDREGLEFDKTGDNVISKDNTKPDGKLSIDFGSVFEDSGRANQILGRVVSIGNYCANQEQRKCPEFYHNKESFYKELGQADVFKEIVNTLKKYIKEKYVR
ncbi:hypothetical protein KKD20_02115 [Patescibacteria group bacterium]|nr:hypothetical protein [Patescibacteria group bacterium]